MLGILDGGEAYGWEISKVLSERGLIAGEGTLYPLLNRLHREGLVSTRWQQSESGRRRKYYALTGEGYARLNAFRGVWGEFRNNVDKTIGSHDGGQG